MTAAGVLDENGKAGGESRLMPKPEQRNVGTSLPLRKAKGRAVGPRMGQCSLCGYISSQPVCKACTLLQGLNKHRPKLDIEIAPT
jgi:cytoplasmic tRNA 2-thiolation protein 1